MLFTVEKSTKSVNGGFVNTLTAESLITVFGVKKSVKHRYQLKTDEEIKEGTQEDLNMEEWTMEKYKNDVLDEKTGEIKTLTSTYLHRKAS